MFKRHSRTWPAAALGAMILLSAQPALSEETTVSDFWNQFKKDSKSLGEGLGKAWDELRGGKTSPSQSPSPSPSPSPIPTAIPTWAEPTPVETEEPAVTPPPVPTQILTPELAIRLALSEPLRHVGRTKFHPDNTIPGCVWRNSSIYVVDSYCTKKDVVAANLAFVTPDGQILEFYIEKADRDRTTISEVYGAYPSNWVWRIFYGYKTAQFSENPERFFRMSMSEFMSFFFDNGTPVRPGYCNIGFAAEASRPCHDMPAEIAGPWARNVAPFYTSPSREWTDYLKHMRGLNRQF